MSAMKTLRLFSICAALLLIPGVSKPQVNEPIPCKASFTIDLDSATSHPFLYHFKDASSGNINSWQWDFGDGAISTDQNPSHQYETGGNYQICLTVTNTEHPDSCYDQFCRGIITQSYFSLGGLVYAGELPLNNPLPAGDTGIASIYRVTDNLVSFVEEQKFSDYGYYWFGYVLPGKYLVKISLTETSSSHGKFFSTYLGNKVNWSQAGIISLTNGNLYEETVSLVPVREPATGPGMIKGFVNFEQNGEYSPPPVNQTTVILADKDKTPLVYTCPDASGYFSFSNLPLETYFVSADATGKPSTVITVTLTDSAPVAEGINLTIFGGNVSGVPEELMADLAITRVFPNPIRDLMSMQVFSSRDIPVTLRINDLSGKSCHISYHQLGNGLNLIQIPVVALGSGMYVLSLIPDGKSYPVAVKFVK